MRPGSVFIVLSLIAASLPSAATDSTTSAAKKLLEQGQAEQAYQLLDSESAANTDPEVDYLLGIAALDAGHPGVALFAFERTLMVSPNHVFARAELGRALLRLGEVAEADKEFDAVLAQNPPDDVRKRIAQFRADRHLTIGAGLQVSGFVEAFGGYDSNYASATSDRQVGIPVFGNILFTLDDLFVKDGSGVAGGRAGARIMMPLDQRTLLVSDVEVGGHAYPDSLSDFFDASIRGNVGVLRRLDARTTVAVTINGFNTWVIGLDYLHSLGLTGSWNYALTADDELQSASFHWISRIRLILSSLAPTPCAS